LNELGNEELLSANKDESGNLETRNDGSGSRSQTRLERIDDQEKSKLIRKAGIEERDFRDRR
jgi:hypothetical protein